MNRIFTEEEEEVGVLKQLWNKVVDGKVAISDSLLSLSNNLTCIGGDYISEKMYGYLNSDESGFEDKMTEVECHITMYKTNFEEIRRETS